MQNRYLCRAKRIDNGEFIEGLLTIMWGQFHIINPDDENTAYPIDESTICWCTGLEDKNGKLIFENDIVSGKMYLDHGQWGESVDDKRLVEWNADYARFDPCSHMKLDKYEVIGNIFDNPELLEEGA